MSDRCEKTDLPIGQCADSCCRPDLAQPEPAEQVRVQVQFEARHDSRCDICEGRIKVGEQMGYGQGDARVCQRHLS